MSSWGAVGEGAPGVAEESGTPCRKDQYWRVLGVSQCLPVEGTKALRWDAPETRQERQEATGLKEAVRGRRGG